MMKGKVLMPIADPQCWLQFVMALCYRHCAHVHVMEAGLLRPCRSAPGTLTCCDMLLLVRDGLVRASRAASLLAGKATSLFPSFRLFQRGPFQMIGQFSAQRRRAPLST